MRLQFEYVTPTDPPIFIPAQFPGEFGPRAAAMLVEDMMGDDVEAADSQESWPVVFWAPKVSAWLYVHKVGPRLVWSRD